MRHTVTLATEEAKAACEAIAHVIHADSIVDADQWHSRLGVDGCEFCNALINLRQAAGYEPIDIWRP